MKSTDLRDTILQKKNLFKKKFKTIENMSFRSDMASYEDMGNLDSFLGPKKVGKSLQYEYEHLKPICRPSVDVPKI